MDVKDDLELIRECLNGNTKAFETLVDRYQKALFNVSLRMVNDYEDARDITQRVLIKAYQKLGTFRQDLKFFSWIYRIAINESINFIKQRGYFQPLEEDIISDVQQADKHYESIRLSMTIQKALMELRTEYRAVIILRHFEDLSYEEIGKVLGISAKTVKSRIFIARRQLGDILLRRGQKSHG